jgi:hypothetical protein
MRRNDGVELPSALETGPVVVDPLTVTATLKTGVASLPPAVANVWFGLVVPPGCPPVAAELLAPLLAVVRVPALTKIAGPAAAPPPPYP